MYWDSQYKQDNQIWGTEPSVLARFASAYLKKIGLTEKNSNVIDLGCGYGRDAIFMAQYIPFSILGIDRSREAIRLATESCGGKYVGKVFFEQADILEFQAEKKFDVVMSSNTYHLLKPEERVKFRGQIKALLNPGGHFLMSTMSVKDPQHGGKGDPVPDDANSYLERIYLHMCTEEELTRDFSFLSIRKLYEHEFEETRSDGQIHHHVFWLLAGQYA